MVMMLQAGRLVMGGMRQVVAAGTRQTQVTRTLSSIDKLPYTVPQGPQGENRAARLELAAAHRGLDLLGLNEGVFNHLSVMAPRSNGEGEAMLVVEYGLHWNEVTASGLLEVDKEAKVVRGDGEPDIAASCIHRGIREIRPDAKVIMHTHQPYATALACLKDPTLLMVHQNSTRFYQRVAYDKHYSGLALAIDEGRRLGKVLGDKDVLFLGHHGVVVVASTVALAFDNLYYLERAAQVQVLAMSTNKEVELIPEEECKRTSDDMWRDIKNYSDANFYAIYRRLCTSQPSFET